MGYFFFSSRRRHTRYWRDWSSDVCSSDLTWKYATSPSTTWPRTSSVWNHSMLRTVSDALRTAVRMASSTLVGLLPTTSVSRYTWLLIAADRKSTRLNSSHANISYAVFCLKKKNKLYITMCEY